MKVCKKCVYVTHVLIEAKGIAITSCGWRAVFEHGYAQGSEKNLILPM